MGTALDEPERPAVIEPEGGGTDHDPQLRQSRRLRHRRRQPPLLRFSARHCEKLAAGLDILVDERDPGAGARRAQRRGEPRRPGADDGHVAEGVAHLVAVGIGRLARPAEAGGAADPGLIEFPAVPRRTHEGLVVEAGGQQRRGQGADGLKIEAERRPAILAFGDETVMQLDDRRRDVGLAPGAFAQRHERIRLLGASRIDPPGAVIFEAAADKDHVVGEQGRRQRVAGKAGEPPPVEGKGDRARAVDIAAGSCPPLRKPCRLPRQAYLRDGVRPGVANDDQPLPAAHRMLPELAMAASRVGPDEDIAVPGRRIRLAMAWPRHRGISAIAEFVMVARAAAGTIDPEHGYCSQA